MEFVYGRACISGIEGLDYCWGLGMAIWGGNRPSDPW